MEPPQTKIGFISTVIAVEEKFDRVYVSGFGHTAEFKSVSKGWFVGLDGSYEWLKVGEAKPNVNIGDTATVRISFHAKV